MRLVFLCGGTGKRMFPITEDKFLLSFAGKTLLEHQIDLARNQGLTDFVIVGNPGNMQRIKDIVAAVPGANAQFALQTEPLGIADALKRAAGILSGEILVVNPNDVFAGSAYESLLQAYSRRSAASYLLGYTVNQYFPGGYLAVNGQDELTRIVEKPRPGTEPSDLVNILLHLHTDVRELLQYISKVRTTSDDVYECAVDSMVQDHRKIKVVRYDGFWAPIKYPWHIFNVVRHFLDSGARRIPSSASIAESAVVSGNVVLGDNVRVLENAAIKGPVYIGSNTVVGNNALVREYSHIGAGCVVGFSTEIKGSYVGDNCWFHSSYIGDSVIGSNCSFGAGAVTANFRFDEKAVGVRYADAAISTGRDHFGAIIGDNCRIGINAGILPGHRVGPNSIVGSHVCLSDDLEPGMVITGQPKYHLARRDVQLGKREEELQEETGGRDA